LGVATEAGGQRGQKGGGPPVAAHVSGLHVHGASAAPTPGEREGTRGVQARGTQTHVPDARGVTRARRGRAAAVPRRVVRLLWLCGSAVELQGAGLLGPPSVALLPVEAVGSASISGTAPAWGEPGAGLEHGQIRSWAVAFEP